MLVARRSHAHYHRIVALIQLEKRPRASADILTTMLRMPITPRGSRRAATRPGDISTSDDMSRVSANHVQMTWYGFPTNHFECSTKSSEPHSHHLPSWSLSAHQMSRFNSIKRFRLSAWIYYLFEINVIGVPFSAHQYSALANEARARAYGFLPAIWGVLYYNGVFSK